MGAATPAATAALACDTELEPPEELEFVLEPPELDVFPADAPLLDELELPHAARATAVVAMQTSAAKLLAARGPAEPDITSLSLSPGAETPDTPKSYFRTYLKRFSSVRYFSTIYELTLDRQATASRNINITGHVG